jgi:hypothetical protein
LAELERVWRGLEPPPAAPVPAGLGARLALVALERQRAGRLGTWLAGGARAMPAPAWGRPLVAGALTAGLALGVWLGEGMRPAPALDAGRGVRGPESAVAAGTAQDTGGSREQDRLAARAESGGAAVEGVPESDPGEPDRAGVESADPDLDDTEWASLGDDSVLFGEPTLAEAYLQALEGGGAAWEDSVW